MKILKYRFALHSENPDTLAKFYIEILDFKLTVKVDRKDEYGFGIEAAPGYKLWIAKHSKIKGKSKDKFRILISFYVDNVKEYFEKVKAYDSSLIIEKPTEYCKEVPGEERLVCAFHDPDGNSIQMMQLL
jgi:predicted enzyme related to lactoylglutathione lyase